MSETWVAWLDWANEEVLAVEEAHLTPALRRALQQERTEVRRVEAGTWREAVERAFPERPRQKPSPFGRRPRVS